MSTDGQYYVALFYPVSTPALANVVEGQSFETLEAYQSHIQENNQGLDILTSADFSPDLAALDTLVQSLQVGSTP